MRIKWMILLAGLIVGLTAACGGSTETRDDSFVVGEFPRIVVEGKHGRIIVNPGADGMVRVLADLRKPSDMEYQAIQEGDTISVNAREKENGPSFFSFGRSPGADIEITAPSNARVEVRTRNGEVQLYGMHRSGSVRTSNGDIVMDDVVGEFDVSTSNGAVNIKQARGTFDVISSNGRIEFDGEFTPGGRNHFTTSNGSVEITLRGAPNVKLDASSGNGSVSNKLPFLLSSPGDKHHVAGTIGAGDAELFVRTSNGSIKIR